MSETPLCDTPVLPDYVQPVMDGSDSGVLRVGGKKVAADSFYWHVGHLVHNFFFFGFNFRWRHN